jgi:hypothetical protein
MALSGPIQLIIQLAHTGASDLTSPTETVINSANYSSWTVADGTSANQMDLVWSDQRTLGAGASENLDLAGGLTDIYGNTLTFARIKFIYVSAATANGDYVQLGGGTNPFINWVANASDIVNVAPDGMFALTAPDATGYAVTAGTGDILKVTNADGAAGVTYDIVLAGASA